MTIKAIMARVAILTAVFSSLMMLAYAAFGQSEVVVTWNWAPPASGVERVAGYYPYTCLGTCDSSGIWVPESDVRGKRVVFPPCVESPCVHTYLGTWGIGVTYSFSLTAFDAQGKESAPSNIVVQSRTTTTTLPEMGAPVLNAVEISEMTLLGR